MAHRVLVVDDDQAIHALAKESLSNWFTHCIGAYDGETGVKYASEQKPDAILLDMNMPGLNGYEVCRQLKWNRATQDIPVIFLTSRSDMADKLKGMGMGAVDYITKPFDPDELRVRVRSVLRSHEAVQLAEARMATDKRSGLFNRTYFEHRVETDASTARRWRKPLACFLAAVEDWQGMSAKLGPHSLDQFVRVSAEGIVASLRKEDVTCHWDEQTYAVLGFASDKGSAIELGNRIRLAISDAGYMCGLTTVQPAVTIGVALSKFSGGGALLKKTVETLADARQHVNGSILFGGELSEPRLADWAASRLHN